MKFINNPKNKSKQSKNKKQNKQTKNKGRKSPVVKLSNPKKFLPPAVARRPAAKSTGGALLSRCALRFASAIADPFAPGAKLACIPAFPSPDSFKVTGFVRQLVTVGTSGYGFINISPVLSNDAPIAMYSTSTFVGLAGAINALSANNTLSVGVNTLTMPNLPFSSAQVAPSTGATLGVSGRIVSVGVRLTYVGTTLNESGVYYCLTTPAHENLAPSVQTFAALSAYEQCDVTAVTREPCFLTAYPVSPNEASYTSSWAGTSATSYLYPYCGGSSFVSGNPAFTTAVYTYAIPAIPAYTMGCPVMAVQISGVAGSQFMVEIIQHCEFTGELAAAMSTPGEADQRGFELVTAAAARLPALKNTKVKMSGMDMMKSALYSVAVALKPIAISAISKGVAGLLL